MLAVAVSVAGVPGRSVFLFPHGAYLPHPAYCQTSSVKPCESLWGSSATTPLVDFYHRLTACPSYEKSELTFISSLQKYYAVFCSCSASAAGEISSAIGSVFTACHFLSIKLRSAFRTAKQRILPSRLKFLAAAFTSQLERLSYGFRQPFRDLP